MSTTNHPTTGSQGASMSNTPASAVIDPAARAAAEAAAKEAMNKRFGGGVTPAVTAPRPALAPTVPAKKPTGAAAHKKRTVAATPAPADSNAAQGRDASALTIADPSKYDSSAGLAAASPERVSVAGYVMRKPGPFDDVDPILLKVATEIYAASIGTNINYANGTVMPAVAISALRHAKNLLDAFKRFPDLSTIDPK